MRRTGQKTHSNCKLGKIVKITSPTFFVNRVGSVSGRRGSILSLKSVIWVSNKGQIGAIKHLLVIESIHKIFIL